MNHPNHLPDEEQQQPTAPPVWVDQPAQMVENVYNVMSSDVPSDVMENGDKCFHDEEINISVVGPVW